MLTLLTATGCRPEAWKICQKLMQRQTYAGPVHWIIVDDGETPQIVDFYRENWKLTIINPTPHWQPGQNTQARNLAQGLRMVSESDNLVIIEDDDCYYPQWLERVEQWLKTHDLVGESFARYYNIQTKQARQLQNRTHASLCATAMKGEAIFALKKYLKPSVQFIDLNLWKNFQGKKALYTTEMVLGIKGLPGRGGIGMGHKTEFKGQFDDKGSILRQWATTNADLYQ
jgi:hypothetical protein